LEKCTGDMPISYEDTEGFKLSLYGPEETKVGILKIIEAKCFDACSFLDCLFLNIPITPIIATDFSMSNLTFDDRNCLHRL
jgi:hypothetical protein